MKEISREKLEERIFSIYDKGWNAKIVFYPFNLGKGKQEIYDPKGHKWDSSKIYNYKESFGKLSENARTARRLINLTKIHYLKYSNSWETISNTK